MGIRWTMAYFAAALFFLLAAEAMMAVGYSFRLFRPKRRKASCRPRRHDRLGLLMSGTLLQFVPVPVGRSLQAERLLLPALLCILLGLVLLLAGYRHAATPRGRAHLHYRIRMAHWPRALPALRDRAVPDMAGMLWRTDRQRPTPRVQDLVVVEHRGRVWFSLYHTAVTAGTVALLMEPPPAFRWRRGLCSRRPRRSLRRLAVAVASSAMCRSCSGSVTATVCLPLRTKPLWPHAV